MLRRGALLCLIALLGESPPARAEPALPDTGIYYRIKADLDNQYNQVLQQHKTLVAARFSVNLT